MRNQAAAPNRTYGVNGSARTRQSWQPQPVCIFCGCLVRGRPKSARLKMLTVAKFELEVKRPFCKFSFANNSRTMNIRKISFKIVLIFANNFDFTKIGRFFIVFDLFLKKVNFLFKLAK